MSDDALVPVEFRIVESCGEVEVTARGASQIFDRFPEYAHGRTEP